MSDELNNGGVTLTKTFMESITKISRDFEIATKGIVSNYEALDKIEEYLSNISHALLQHNESILGKVSFLKEIISGINTKLDDMDDSIGVAVVLQKQLDEVKYKLENVEKMLVASSATYEEKQKSEKDVDTVINKSISSLKEENKQLKKWLVILVVGIILTLATLAGIDIATVGGIVP